MTRDLLDAAEGLPQGYVLGVVIGAGVFAAIALGVAALRSTGRMRRAWSGLVAMAVFWTAGHAAVLLGMPVWADWWLFRPAAMCGLFVGLLAFPGVGRSARDWLVVVLDGWMTVGGVFVVGWMELRHAVPGHGLTFTGIGWVIAGQLTLCLLGGLVAQVAAGHRAPVVYVFVAGLVGGLADMVIVLTGGLAAGFLLWALAIGMVGAGPVFGSGEMFVSAFADPETPRMIHIFQLPLLPAFYVLLVPVERDAVASIGALLVVLVIFGNVAVNSRQNAQLLRAVREQSTRFRQLLRDSRDAIVQLDAEGRVAFVNDAAPLVLGRPAAGLIGRPWTELVHPDDADRVATEVRTVGLTGTAARVDARILTEDGRVLASESTVNRSREGGGWVLSTRDVTDRTRLRDELAEQARTDALTGLLNRSAFLERADELLAEDRQAIVLFIDLDGFKTVNDTLGHAAGDELLKQVSTRLVNAAAPGDAVARLGGDEFAVLARSPVLHHATSTAAALIDAVTGIDQPVRGGTRISASVGLAAGRGISAAQLLREADLAMYRAKASGGGSVVVFEDWMSERVLERSRTRGRLEIAIEDGGLVVEMQPVVRLDSGEWEGFEALVRWEDGGRRRGPDEFIPLAEESGLVVPLGGWVLREALRQLATWPDPAAGVAVNVSPRQIEDDRFAQEVLVALDRAGIAPGRLTLEITEQTAVEDLGRTASRLDPLRRRGVHVAVDDFGTGFSSMRYLTRLPVDALKIDRQFVDGLGVRAEDEVLVVSMLRLAADLGLDVVAEGVETAHQAEVLRSHGCRLAQGFLFSPPRPLDDLRGATRSPVPAQRPPGSRRV